MNRRALAFLLSAWALGACGEARDTPVVEVRDSAGIRIVENTRSQWGEGAGWSVGADPDARLGVLEGDPGYQLDGVTGAARLQDGTLVVADAGSNEVRFFDEAGALRSIAGGPGEGPGEFTGLSGLGATPEGAVWAYDFSLRRVTWFHPSGTVDRLVSLDSQPPMLNAVGPLPDGTFLLKQLWGATAVAEASESGLRRDPVAFVRFDLDGHLVDTLGLFPGREVFLTEEDGRGVMSTPPFARNAVGTVWGSGVVVGLEESFELVRYGLEGRAEMIVRIPGWDSSLGPDDLEAYIQGRLVGVDPQRRASVRQEIEAMPVPATKPAYGSLLADEEGNLWVGAWSSMPDVPERWTVIDPSGQWLGEVAMPHRFFPFAIGPDWILGVEWDDLDVEYVVLYPLLKEVGASG